MVAARMETCGLALRTHSNVNNDAKPEKALHVLMICPSAHHDHQLDNQAIAKSYIIMNRQQT